MAQAKWRKKFTDGVMDSGRAGEGKYKLIYGAGNALEPFYYQIIGALATLGYRTVKKVYDYYNISPKTQEFGFASSNLRQEMSSASQLLGQVGQVAKSVVALKKDKQRVKECLDYYKDKGKADDITLKGLWADMVDPKSGAASFVNAAKNLDLYVARDWFFKIKDSKELEAMPPEKVPGSIRNYLLRKFNEYEKWKLHWKESLLDFEKIIDQQYSASEKTIELYRQWVQPLLYNIESLKMKGEYGLEPGLLKVSSNLLSEVYLVSWNAGFYQEPKDLKTARDNYAKNIKKRDESKKKGEFVPDYIPIGKAFVEDKLGRKIDSPFVPVIEIKLRLIGPTNAQFMTTEADITGRIYTVEEFEHKLFDEWTKDPAEEWIKSLLLKEGLELGEYGQEKKTEKSGIELFPGQEFMSLIGGKLGKLMRKAGSSSSKGTKLTDHMINFYLEETKSTLNKRVYLVYYILKKSFGLHAFTKVD